MAKDDSPSIPAWQKAASGQSAEQEDESSRPGADLAAAEEAASAVMPSFDFKDVDELAVAPTREEAKKFLEHPGTNDASLDDKIRFLELKNVKREDIEALLPGAKKYYEDEEAKFQKDLMEDASSDQAAPNLPPVVTYPEFLVKKKAPPLVTTNMLLNTMYGTAGSITGLYALSKYALEPMHKSLSEARHDFFTFSGEKVEDFNSRMSKLTSTFPVKALAKEKTAVAEDADDVSVDSDPTELFHRDIGIQTEPEIQRQHSSWSLPESEMSNQDPITSHESRLSSLTKHIRDLEESGKISDGREKDVHDQLDLFSSYLNDILYTGPYYSWKNNVPSWSGVTNAASSDEFDKFKQEIRSIKGAMLSSRNFPRGG